MTKLLALAAALSMAASMLMSSPASAEEDPNANSDAGCEMPERLRDSTRSGVIVVANMVSIDGNKLPEIKSEAPCWLTQDLSEHLTTFRVRNVDWDTFDAYHLGDYPKLTSITVQSARLRTLPSNLYRVENLRVLNLSRNWIKHVPEELHLATPNLAGLDLSYNVIERLPKDISKLNLVDLNMKDNLLTSLPKRFIRLRDTLQTLDVHQNLLGELPSLKRFAQLKRVNYSYNILKEAPTLPAHQVQVINDFGMRSDWDSVDAANRRLVRRLCGGGASWPWIDTLLYRYSILWRTTC